MFEDLIKEKKAQENEQCPQCGSTELGMSRSSMYWCIMCFTCQYIWECGDQYV